MYLGVDYYPEHWDVSMIDEDLDRIVATGANTIRIGEFAWHMIEPMEGQFDFSYFDNFIKKAKIKGLNLIFGTPTATFPAWLALKEPSILSEDINGNKRVFGGRRQYCFNSPIYLKYANRITRELVKHYKDEQAIVAWQVDNEFGHEGSDMCYCSLCHKGFQAYLNQVYDAIEGFNTRSGTIFWGQTYNEFTEIPIPKKTITSHNPTLQLEWARFRSECINKFALNLIELVRCHKGGHQVVTHNYFGGFFNVHYDQVAMSQALDVVSYDNYPVWGGLEEPISPGHIGMTHDYMRGLKGQKFWILEELMGAQGHKDIGYLPRPNQGKLWAYQAMARGCTSMLFFRWRTMTRGAEQFCLGILDANNRDNQKLEEVTAFFKDIRQYEEVLNQPIESQVAVLYDYDNRWSWGGQPQSASFDFTNEFLRLYEGFYAQNVQIDVIPTIRDFSQYKVLVLPVMQIIDDTLAKRLKDFARAGGVLLFSFRAGIKDKDNNLYFGQIAPCKIADLCGIEIEAYESLGKGTKVPIRGGNGLSVVYTASVWRDLIRLTTAESIMTYDDDFYRGYDAVTKNSYGKGYAYYIGCGLEEKAINALIKKIIQSHDIEYLDAPKGVEVIKRGAVNKGITMIMNHNAFSLTYDGIDLAPYEVYIRE